MDNKNDLLNQSTQSKLEELFLFYSNSNREMSLIQYLTLFKETQYLTSHKLKKIIEEKFYLKAKLNKVTITDFLSILSSLTNNVSLFFNTYFIQLYHKIKSTKNNLDSKVIVDLIISTINNSEAMLFEKIISLHNYFFILILDSLNAKISTFLKENTKKACSDTFLQEELIKLLKLFNICPSYITQREAIIIIKSVLNYYKDTSIFNANLMYDSCNVSVITNDKINSSMFSDNASKLTMIKSKSLLYNNKSKSKLKSTKTNIDNKNTVGLVHNIITRPISVNSKVISLSKSPSSYPLFEEEILKHNISAQNLILIIISCITFDLIENKIKKSICFTEPLVDYIHKRLLQLYVIPVAVKKYINSNNATEFQDHITIAKKHTIGLVNNEYKVIQVENNFKNRLNFNNNDDRLMLSLISNSIENKNKIINSSRVVNYSDTPNLQNSLFHLTQQAFNKVYKKPLLFLFITYSHKSNNNLYYINIQGIFNLFKEALLNNKNTKNSTKITHSNINQVLLRHSDKNDKLINFSNFSLFLIDFSETILDTPFDLFFVSFLKSFYNLLLVNKGGYSDYKPNIILKVESILNKDFIFKIMIDKINEMFILILKASSKPMSKRLSYNVFEKVSLVMGLIPDLLSKKESILAFSEFVENFEDSIANCKKDKFLINFEDFIKIFIYCAVKSNIRINEKDTERDMFIIFLDLVIRLDSYTTFIKDNKLLSVNKKLMEIIEYYKRLNYYIYLIKLKSTIKPVR